MVERKDQPRIPKLSDNGLANILKNIGHDLGLIADLETGIYDDDRLQVARSRDRSVRRVLERLDDPSQVATIEAAREEARERARYWSGWRIANRSSD